MSQLRAQNLSAMLQVTAYNTESLTSLIYICVPVHGRPNRPCTFLKSIVTGHRTANPLPIPQTITRSTLGSLGYTPMLEYAWVLGVVWYSNDRMVAGLGLLPGTAPNGAAPPAPAATCHPVLRILSAPLYSSSTSRVTGQYGTLCVVFRWCVVRM